MLAGQVNAPVNREFKLVTFLDSLFQNLDTLGIGKAHEIVFYHEVQAVNQGLVNHFVEELQIVLTILKSPVYTILDEVLGQVHVVVDVVEGHFGLNHPELSQMTRRVGIFSTESRTKRIDGSQCSSSQLSFKLATHGQ